MAHAHSPLSTYRAKRNFAKTAEPQDDRANAVEPSQHLRFVIQKHDARRLHYDLRLELDGVFRSWAVTRGPSLDPGEKRLAVEVEDHPLAYGDFEGTIPPGEYGGGTVMIWDRGFWAPETATSPAQSLRDGELKFIVAGDKLQGSFVLVRLKRRNREARNNWLLIKHKDDFATPSKDTVQRKDRSVASGRSMAQIAKGQGRGAAVFMTSGKSVAPDAVWHSHPSGESLSVRPRPSPVPVTMPRLTHPERVLWPGEPPVSKHDLAAYLVAVAPWMIDHMHGRPCSFVRAPDGITGEHFFQRHPMAGQPSSLTATIVGRKREAYLQVDDAQTIAAMAQFSVLEFHPWNCAPGLPHVPGRLVFDLDPAPDVPFEAVVDAARDVRALLKAIGLVAFCKTSGGKGLHVVTPLVPDSSMTWDQAKLFAQAVANRIAGDAPARFVTTMSKKQRAGRIFIDYLRNDDTATAVAPLSPRARPGATVSMPLTWGQVKKGLDPGRFTIATVPAMLAKSQAWGDYDAAARPLRKAIEALIGIAP